MDLPEMKFTLKKDCRQGESESEAAQSCPTLCDPMDCSLSESSVHGILQARILEWIAISFSRGCSQPRDRTQVSRIAGRRFTIWATREKKIVDRVGDWKRSPSWYKSVGVGIVTVG